MKWNRKSIRRVPTSFFYISLSFIQNRLILCILLLHERSRAMRALALSFTRSSGMNGLSQLLTCMRFSSPRCCFRQEEIPFHLSSLSESTASNQDQKPSSRPPITCTWLIRGASNWLIVNKFLFGFGSLMKGFCKPLFVDDSARFLRCECPTKCCWKRRRHVEGVSRDS